MATITEDYVSFETAKLLKEKGFDDIDCECHGWIGKSGKHYSADDTFYNDKELKKAQEDRKDFIPLITFQMAMKWLRKKHMIFIQPNIVFTTQPICYYATIYCYGDNLKTQQDITTERYETPEEACETSIKYCLENLI